MIYTGLTYGPGAIVGHKWGHPPGVSAKGNELLTVPMAETLPSQVEMELWQQELADYLGETQRRTAESRLANLEGLLAEKGLATRDEVEGRRG